MKEVQTGIPAAEKLQARVNAAEAAPPIRETKQKPHRRPLQPPPLQGDRQELHPSQSKDDLSTVEEEQKVFVGVKIRPFDPTPLSRERLDKIRSKLGFKPFTAKEWEKFNEQWNSPEAIEQQRKIHEKSATLLSNLTYKQLSENFWAGIRQRQREQREKAAWMHSIDPRYGPMTGDLLLHDELPLSPTASYHLMGTPRARCFLPPDHPALERAPRVQTDEKEQEPESPSNEQLIQ